MEQKRTFLHRLADAVVVLRSSEGLKKLSQMRSWFNANRSTSGVDVNEASALTISAVYSAVSQISDSISILPISVESYDNQIPQLAPAHPVNKILRKPNPLMGGIAFRSAMVSNLLLRGNFFFLTPRDGAARIIELVPVPDQNSVRVVISKGAKFFRYTDRDGKSHTLDTSQMGHIMGLTLDGLVGVSVLTAARESMGLSIAADRFAGKFYKNGASASVVLETDAALSDKAYTRLVNSFKGENAGLANAHSPALLEEGLKAKAISLSPQDSQLIESRRFTVEDVARFFNMPPAMLGELSNSSTRANVEEQGIQYVRKTLLPWVRKIEEQLSELFFFGAEEGKYGIRQNLDSLMRGDLKSRYESYAKAINWGWLNVNEVRAYERLANIGEQGDVYLRPVNMQDANTPPPDPNLN